MKFSFCLFCSLCAAISWFPSLACVRQVPWATYQPQFKVEHHICSALLNVPTKIDVTCTIPSWHSSQPLWCLPEVDFMNTSILFKSMLLLVFLSRCSPFPHCLKSTGLTFYGRSFRERRFISNEGKQCASCWGDEFTVTVFKFRTTVLALEKEIPGKLGLVDQITCLF